jgi:hypothetical protein
LPRGEDGNDAVPVVRFELVGGIDQYKPERPGGEFREGAGDVQKVGGGAVRQRGVGGGDEEPAVEEGLDVRHAEEGGGRRGEQDDWVGALGGGGGGAGGERRGGLDAWVGDGRAAVFVLAEEGFGGFAHMREVLGGLVWAEWAGMGGILLV